MNVKTQFNNRKLGVDYYLLLTAFFTSEAGSWLYKLALPLLILEITGSPSSMAISYGIVFLPFLLVSVFGGVIADRYNRRTVLIVGDLIAAAITFFFVFFVSISSNITAIYVLVFLVALAPPLYHPCFQSFIPDIVHDDLLPKANSLISSAENTIVVLAPVIGGLTIALVGVRNAILIDGASFLVSGVLIFLIKKKGKITGFAKNSTVLADIKEGFQISWAHPVLKFGALLFIGTNFAIHIFSANLMFYLNQQMGASESKIGLVFGIVGFLSICGSLIAPYFISRFQSGKIIAGATALGGLISYGLLFISDPLLVGVIWGGSMACSSIVIVTYFTLRQRVISKEILGRAIATTRLISFSSIPIAALCGSFLVDIESGMIWIILTCSSVRLLVGVCAYFTPLVKTQFES